MLGHGNIGLPGTWSVKGKYRTTTVIVNGIKHKVKTKDRYWCGNACGYNYWIDGGSKRFVNVLTRDEAIQKAIRVLENES